MSRWHFDVLKLICHLFDQSVSYCNVLSTRVGLTKYKYIGHCISDDLSDDDDMARQCRQIYAQGNALLRKKIMCTESVKITLFRSFSTSLYTCELWCQYRSE